MNHEHTSHKVDDPMVAVARAQRMANHSGKPYGVFARGRRHYYVRLCRAMTAPRALEVCHPIESGEAS